MDRAGIAGNKRGSHCLRHSLGTNYIDAGGDPFTLKRIMRHRNITTTQKYVNFAMHTVVKHHHQFSPLRDALRAAQAGFFDANLAIKEAEAILNARKDDLVGAGVTPVEKKANRSNAGAGATAATNKAGDGASKWGVTPLLPGLSEL